MWEIRGMKDEKRGTAVRQKELWVSTDDCGLEWEHLRLYMAQTASDWVMGVGAGSCVSAPQNGADEGRSIPLWQNAI